MVIIALADQHVFWIVQCMIICLSVLAVSSCEWVADDTGDLPFYVSVCRTVEKAVETRRRNCYY
jgi:hypothetical protein